MTLVGASAPRIDGVEKATGRTVYAPDLARPGMLHGKVLRSQVAHGRVERVDASAARRLPGVHAVLTAAEVPDVRFGGVVMDVPLLARDRVRYVGEPVAVVAATTPDIAAEALRLIEVDIEELPLLDDPEEAMRPDAQLLHEEWASYTANPIVIRHANVCGESTLQRGDPTAAFDEPGLVIVEGTYRTQVVHQGYLEPRAVLAEATPGGRVTVWTTTQLPFGIRDELALILGVPVGRVRVIPTAMGGGFGAKLRICLEHYAALLALRTGRPVRMLMGVDEALIADAPRAGSVCHVRSAVRPDGTLVAREVRQIHDAGAYAGSGPGYCGSGALVAAGPYRIPHLRIDNYAVYTNKANMGSYRAPSAPQANFPIESHMDEIAARLGLDPLQVRLKNLLEDGDLGPTGQQLGRVTIRECLERAAQAIGWGEPATRPGVGKGLACTWWTVTQGSSTVVVTANEDSSIRLVTGCVEIGTGALAAGVVQLVADRFGVGVDEVSIVQGDTDAVPYDLGPQGSRSLYMVGLAAEDAVGDLQRQLAPIAAGLLEASPEDLEFRAAGVTVRGAPQRRVALGDVIRHSAKHGGTPVGRGVATFELDPYDTSCVEGSLYPTFQDPSFHAHAAEVEVDPETGRVDVRRYVAAHDVGFAVNPALIRGQIEGGVAQGLGQALYEEVVYQDGAVLNPSLAGYRMPSSLNVPTIESILVESPGQHGPFGAKGIGEPPIIPPAATIANAVANACGARVDTLPITPERVLQALDGHAT